MPKVPKLQTLFAKTGGKWSAFPRRPLPFRMVEWGYKKPRGNTRVAHAKKPTPAITPLAEWHIVRGDLVEIMAGRDTGKQGKIRAMARKKNQLKVEGLNLAPQFIEDMGDGNPGYIMEEQPLHVFDVKLVDPHTGLPTETTYKYDESGKKVRVCNESGRIIPKPIGERLDFKSRSAVKEGDQDTVADVVTQYTYVPSMLLFHEEIMREHGVKMSMPKTEPDRRDLIFQELKAEHEQQLEQELIEKKEMTFLEELTSTAKSTVSSFMFWRK